MTNITGTERDNSLYRKDAFVQAWVDRRYIATLVKWLESEGVPPRYMADVVNSALVTMVDALVKQDKVSLVQFTSEADQVINRTIQTKLNSSGRGNKNYKYNLELDDARFEALNRPKPTESSMSDFQSAASEQTDEEMKKEIEKLIKEGKV